MIRVSANELYSTIEKAALGQGFTRGSATWLARQTAPMLQADHPALSWALAALDTPTDAGHLVEAADGTWDPQTRSVLVAAPILEDLLQLELKVSEAALTDLDVPELWHHRLNREALGMTSDLRVEQQNWQALQRLAAKTYVPATAESRAKGAGAGAAGSEKD